MARSKLSAALVGVGTAGAAFVGVYALVVRPWHVRWGATQAETQEPLPGDELVPRPKLVSTRAVTIQAPARQVYPWLVQLGQGRGGFYSYDFLENLIGLGIYSTDRIVPELQDLQVGDTIRTDPKGGFTVARLKPDQAMVLRARISSNGEHLGFEEPLREGSFEGSWAFILKEVDQDTTRLIARFRMDHTEDVPTRLFARVLLEPAVFVMERKMLLGIKERAEREA
jgi:hypothetical protein